MEGGALHDHQRARPARRERLLRDGLTHPPVGPLILGSKLRNRERPPHPASKLVQHGRELKSEVLCTCGVLRSLGETPVGIRPVMSRALDVRRHEAGG